MHAIRIKKYPIDLFTLKGPIYSRSVTIDLTTLTIGSSGIFSLTSLYRANLYISSFSLELAFYVRLGDQSCLHSIHVKTYTNTATCIKYARASV